jgi:hypothetical protein
MSAPGNQGDPERLSSAWRSGSSVEIVSGGARGGVPYAGRASKGSGKGRGRRLSAGGIVAFLMFACSAISLLDLYVLMSSVQ